MTSEFTIAKIRKHSKCPLTEEWIKRMWCIRTAESRLGGWDVVEDVVRFSRSAVSNSVTPWIAARQAFLSITNSQSLLKLISIELVMPSRHLILCCPLLLLPPVPPSIRVFSNESTLHMRWPKYWSLSLSISPSSEYPVHTSVNTLISIRMDWLDLLAVQGTLKSLLQHHSSKASILRYSIFLVARGKMYEGFATREAIKLYWIRVD